jgi:hypothetical protein
MHTLWRLVILLGFIAIWLGGMIWRIVWLFIAIPLVALLGLLFAIGQAAHFLSLISEDFICWPLWPRVRKLIARDLDCQKLEKPEQDFAARRWP